METTKKLITEKEFFLKLCPENYLNEFETFKKMLTNGVYLLYFYDTNQFFVSCLTPCLTYNNYLILKNSNHND